MKVKLIDWNGEVECWHGVRDLEEANELSNQWFKKVKPKRYTRIITYDNGDIDKIEN